MGTTQTILSFEEFERLPEGPGRQELLQGELIEWPPAKLRHNRIAEQIAGLLKAALRDSHARGEATELGFVHHEMGYRLAQDSWLKPDVSVTHAAQPEGDYYEGAPAIAIEVVSRSNSAEEIETKTEAFFDSGAREVWRIYPKARKVIVHLSRTEIVTHYDSVTTRLIPGFSMSIDEMLA